MDFLWTSPDEPPTELEFQHIAEIIGVVIGLKPTTMCDYIFTPEQLTRFQDILTQLHLHFITTTETGLSIDQELTLKIGRLLGYPETASVYFVYGPKDADGFTKFRPESERDRYYIHSPNHAHAEYRKYEDILHAAITHLCPDLTQQVRNNSDIYWTSADL